MSDAVLRPPAVPLIVNDPYLSIWSMADKLTDDWSRHWTGKTQALCGLITIDGVTYRFMGAMPKRMDHDIPAMQQTALRVYPTRTCYRFAAAGVSLELTFITPLLPHDLDQLSRPISYLDMTVSASDDKSHNVTIYLDVSASLCVDQLAQEVVWGRSRVANRNILWMGSKEQPVLAKAGDDLRIDWGYLYTTALGEGAQSALGTDMQLRRFFAAHGRLPEDDDLGMPRPVDNRPPSPVSAWLFQFEGLATKPRSQQLLFAYL